jgi:uncharacterized membrane protein
MKKLMTAALALSALAYGATVLTAQAEKKQTARPSQAVSAAQQAMQECRRQYGGGQQGTNHGFWIRDQWAWVEGCFKEKTGSYPGQAK